MRHELLMNKRKKIRSEARNQARSISKEISNFIRPTNELIQRPGVRQANDNSRKEIKRLHNLTANEKSNDSEVILKAHARHESEVDDQIFMRDLNPSLRNSLVLDSNNEVDSVYQTYRLPSISPNSKLPSCFMQKGFKRLKSSEKRRINMNKSGLFFDNFRPSRQ